jgi:hypothetical protein
MPFGQLVVGPPGSGKTTYCTGMHQYLTAIGRKTAIINLDPANDLLPYTPAVDVADLVDLEAVMDDLHLGPNGGAPALAASTAHQNFTLCRFRTLSVVVCSTVLLCSSRQGLDLTPSRNSAHRETVHIVMYHNIDATTHLRPSSRNLGVDQVGGTWHALSPAVAVGVHARTFRLAQCRCTQRAREWYATS